MFDALYSIFNQGYVQLKPSKVCDGVGVFALRKIPKFTVLFLDVEPDTDLLTWESLEQADEKVVRYLKSICNTSKDGIYLSRTINSINVSYYINHSEQPNTVHNISTDTFVTIKTIEPGEELLCKYAPEDIDWM